jgi:uncharacterized protein YukE
LSKFTTDPDALVDFATRCEGYGHNMDTLVTKLQEAQVGRDAFGHIPWVGSRIYDAYDKHVAQCTQTTTAAASAVHSVSANTAITAANYLHADKGSKVK